MNVEELSEGQIKLYMFVFLTFVCVAYVLARRLWDGKGDSD